MNSLVIILCYRPKDRCVNKTSHDQMSPPSQENCKRGRQNLLSDNATEFGVQHLYANSRMTKHDLARLEPKAERLNPTLQDFSLAW